MNECRGDRIYDDVSLICDKIEGVVVCFFFFYRKNGRRRRNGEGKERGSIDRL
jgi:hypothetical protein